VEITRALSPQAGEELFELLPQTGGDLRQPVATGGNHPRPVTRPEEPHVQPQVGGKPGKLVAAGRRRAL